MLPVMHGISPRMRSTPSVGFQMTAFEVSDLTIHFVQRLPVPLPDLADELVTLPGDHVDIVVGQLSPLLADLALELLLIPFDRVLVHGSIPLYEGLIGTPLASRANHRAPRLVRTRERTPVLPNPQTRACTEEHPAPVNAGLGCADASQRAASPRDVPPCGA